MPVTELADYAEELLALANAALATTDAGEIPRAFVAPAAPALDCCPQLTVHVQSILLENTSPTSPVTAPGHRLVTTGAVFLASLVVTVVRCIPVSEGHSPIPTAAAQQAAALTLDTDLWAIWNAIATAKRAGTLFGGRCPALYLDPPSPQLAEGACAGWVIPIRAAIPGYKVAL